MKHPIWWPLAWLTMVGLLVVVGLVSIVWNLLALLLYPLLPRDVGKRIGRAGISFGYRFLFGVSRATGMLRINAKVLDALTHEAGLIIVANHPSLVDALILVARLPRSFCLMKAGLARNPLLGPGARLARYIRNDSALGLVRRAVTELRDGGQLVMFPEGSRTVHPPIDPFRPGVTLIAKRADVPIQTVFIDTDTPYLSKGWPLWRLPPLPVRFHVRLGRRFAPMTDSDALLQQLEDYFAQGVRCSQRSATP